MTTHFKYTRVPHTAAQLVTTTIGDQETRIGILFPAFRSAGFYVNTNPAATRPDAGPFYDTVEEASEALYQKYRESVQVDDQRGPAARMTTKRYRVRWLYWENRYYSTLAGAEACAKRYADDGAEAARIDEQVDGGPWRLVASKVEQTEHEARQPEEATPERLADRGGLEIDPRASTARPPNVARS